LGLRKDPFAEPFRSAKNTPKNVDREQIAGV